MGKNGRVLKNKSYKFTYHQLGTAFLSNTFSSNASQFASNNMKIQQDKKITSFVKSVDNRVKTSKKVLSKLYGISFEPTNYIFPMNYITGKCFSRDEEEFCTRDGLLLLEKYIHQKIDLDLLSLALDLVHQNAVNSGNTDLTI